MAQPILQHRQVNVSILVVAHHDNHAVSTLHGIVERHVVLVQMRIVNHHLGAGLSQAPHKRDGGRIARVVGILQVGIAQDGDPGTLQLALALPASDLPCDGLAIGITAPDSRSPVE